MDRLIKKMRCLRQEAMQTWAQGKLVPTEQELRHSGRAHREGQKVGRHTTFDDLSVLQPEYGSASKQMRPFA